MTTNIYSKGPFRAAYAMPRGIPLASRLADLYDGGLGSSDPLFQLFFPVDQRGEVGAWGGPHITLLDALTVTDADRFVDVIQDVCRQYDPPTVSATNLEVRDNKSLVLRCDATSLDQVR